MSPAPQFDRKRCRKLAAVFAILIVGVFATVQVAHGHLPGRSEDSHCAVCLTVHGVATLVALPTLPVLVPVGVQVYTLEVQTAYTAPSISLSIRPPPATA